MEQLITPKKYVNPMIDVAFKYLFGTEKNKHLLKGLLENVFKKEILDITYDNTEKMGETMESRRSSFDVICKSSNGPDFIVECQVRSQKYFAERAVFYTSRVIANQAPKGEWDYNYRPVYFLGLMDFELPDSIGKADGHVQCYSLRNDVNGATMTDRVRYVFMEVEPFDKSYEECTSFEEKFLYFMKNLPTFVDKPDTHNDEYFEELLMEAEYLKMDNETQAQYEKRIMIMRDNKNADDYARAVAIEQGLAEGLKQGLEQGLAKGMEQGLEQGLAKGLEQGLEKGINITLQARDMIKEGWSAQDICEKTGLSEEVVLALM